ncbi:ATP-binding cassette domain-containing protein [uncultured Corynebacterium sp.]|uniref:ATP-binding cassette domain-containing protein n=1 Tax=uncultured Corynebacterium sp. TaxID=159447 RepID=UPI0026321A49|nr:ATP-binding cassette domain-containing protein [uncultured Corynebacterium sp.]
MLTIVNGAFGYERGGEPVVRVGGMNAEKGVVTGLLGANGSGKSTLMKGLSGLLPLASIEKLECDGEEMSIEEFKPRRITVFTEDRSFAQWTFKRYMEFVAGAYRVRELSRLDELIEGFEFREFVDTPLGNLSSGNAKKARLIAAFAVEREYLILDEPVDALDFFATEFLYQEITAARERGTAVLMSSHIFESLKECADCLYIVASGEVSGQFAVPETRKELAELLRNAGEQ